MIRVCVCSISVLKLNEQIPLTKIMVKLLRKESERRKKNLSIPTRKQKKNPENLLTMKNCAIYHFLHVIYILSLDFRE